MKRDITLFALCLACCTICALSTGCFNTESSNEKPIVDKGEQTKPKERKKPPTDFHTLKKLAESGDDIQAIYKLGWAYARGMYQGDMTVPQDRSKALKWLNMAAEKGHAEAAAEMASVYVSFSEFEPDNEKALQLFKRAAEMGDEESMFSLAQAYDSGRFGETDAAEAFKWYKKSAEKGLTLGMEALAASYLAGAGCEKDPEKALYWYKKSAEKGRTDSMVWVGRLYYLGLGVDKDYLEAVRWFRKAADSEGSHTTHSGSYELATMYELGLGVEQDYKKAFELYKNSAERDYMNRDNSMRKLAIFLYQGQGVEKDEKKALDWWKRCIGDSLLTSCLFGCTGLFKETGGCRERAEAFKADEEVAQMLNEQINRQEPVNDQKEAPGDPW